MFLDDALVKIVDQAGQRLVQRLSTLRQDNASFAYHRCIAELQQDLLRHAASISDVDRAGEQRLREIAGTMSLGGRGTPLPDSERPVRASTGLGNPVDQLVSQSDSLTELVNERTGEGWLVGYNDKLRDEYFPRHKLVLVNPEFAGHPAPTVGRMATLLGESRYEPSRLDARTTDRDDYADGMATQVLTKQAHGLLANTTARWEILRSDLRVDIGTPATNDPFHLSTGMAVAKGWKTPDEGVAQMVTALDNEFMPGGLITVGESLRYDFMEDWYAHHEDG